MAYLSVKQLSFSIGGKQLLQSMTLEVALGQIVALLGPNGAGKTTLLKSLIGFNKIPEIKSPEHPCSVTLDGKVINSWPVHQRVTHGLAYLPQHTSLFQHMSVYDNLMLVYEHHTYWNQINKQIFEDEMHHWLIKTELTQTLTQQAGVLSGGQKRKLEVVRALLMHPKIILLDEPFAGVDPKSIYELKKIFEDMALAGIGILISDHHVDQLLSIANMIYVVLKGEIVVSGTVEDILKNSYTRESYLGNQFFDEMSDRYVKK